MAETTKPLGDIDLSGTVNSADVQLYEAAIRANGAHTIYYSESGVKKKEDAVNGGLSNEQANVASLNQNGYVSGLDWFLLKKYNALYPPTTTDRPTIQTFIANLNAQEVIPPTDPSVDTLDQLREHVTENILNLKVYQAEVMLKAETLAAKSLNDMWEKSQRLWCEAYRMDYDTIAHLDGSMITGMETPYEHEDGSGWQSEQPDILANISTIINNTSLGKTDLETIRNKYLSTSLIVISDPPTQEERDTIIRGLISLPVTTGVAFYDEYKSYQPSPGPSPSPTPGQYDPGNNGVVGALSDISGTLTGTALGSWITSSSNSTDFTNVFGTGKANPRQVMTVHQDGANPYNVTINFYEYNGNTWETKNQSPISGFVGTNGIVTVANMQENQNDPSDPVTTPAGAFMLGNYASKESGDVGAFGKNDVTNSNGLNYVELGEHMHWIDGTPNNFLNTNKNWYNTFMDLRNSSNRQLIQYKRSDWDSENGITVLTNDLQHPTLNTKTDNVVFRYGRYYKDGYNQAAYEEDLHYYINGAYQHAVVIRFNMPPHVETPVFPSYVTQTPDGSGSAFFVHTSTGGATGGCVSMPDGNVKELIQWLKHDANPYIFIRLPNSNS